MVINPLPLARNAIDLWHIRARQLPRALYDWGNKLSAQERGRLVQKRQANVAVGERYLVSRLALRLLLSHYLDTPAESIVIAESDTGKPYLVGHPLHFNISHTDDHFCYAFCVDASVGIDVEIERYRDTAGLARRFFAKREVMQILSQGQLDGFYRIWCQKEAYVKYLGQGLRCALDSFSVDVSGLSQPSDTAYVRHYYLQAGIHAAVCSTQPFALRYHDTQHFIRQLILRGAL